MKKKLLQFIKELIGYVIVLLILLFFAKKMGWTDQSIVESTLGLALGWILWRVLVLFINRKKS